MPDIKFGTSNTRFRHRFVHMPLSTLAYHDFLVRDSPLRSNLPLKPDTLPELNLDITSSTRMPAKRQEKEVTKFSYGVSATTSSISSDSINQGVKGRSLPWETAAEESRLYPSIAGKSQRSASTTLTIQSSRMTIMEPAKNKPRRRSMMAPELAAIMKEYPVRMPQITHRLGCRPISGPFGRAKARKMAALEAELQTQREAAATSLAAERAILGSTEPKAKATDNGATSADVKVANVKPPITSAQSSDGSSTSIIKKTIGDGAIIANVCAKEWSSDDSENEGAGDADKDTASMHTGTWARPKTAFFRAGSGAAAKGKLKKKGASRKAQGNGMKKTGEDASSKTQILLKRSPTTTIAFPKAKSASTTAMKFRQSSETHPPARSAISTGMQYDVVNPTLHQLILASAISILGGPPCEENNHNPRLPSFWGIL